MTTIEAKLAAVLNGLSYTASSYQVEIADWIVNGEGHAMVNAVAGSGKTATLTDIAAKLIEGAARFLAFNKHITVELGERLRGTLVSVSTIHSAGMKIVMQAYGATKVEGRKYAFLVDDLLDECYKYSSLCGARLSKDEQAGLKTGGAPRGISMLSRRFTDLCRLTLTDPTYLGISELADHYMIPVEPHQWELLVLVVATAIRQGKEFVAKVIDFTDMVWLPHALDLPGEPFDWVLVDECQDLNKAQLDVCFRLCKEGGRMLFVGDPYQAIYGFAGADCDSFWNIQKRTGAEVLPLSICYRCPSTHVALAQILVPALEAAPNAIEGTIEDIDRDTMVSMLEPDHVVLCRNTAPLIGACYAALAEGKPAYVAGRAIGEGIIKSLDQAMRLYRRKHKTDATMKSLGDAVQLWQDKEEASLERRKIDLDDQRWADLADRVECLIVFWSRSESKTISLFKGEIETLFSEDKDNATRMCTVHRAKGLEADVVYILQPELMPSKYARTSWEKQQERNLQYVAFTRSKRDLYMVGG